MKNSIPGGEITNLLFNYFEGSNEGIVGRKAEKTGSIVKSGERPLEGGGCEIPVRLPMKRWVDEEFHPAKSGACGYT